MNQPKNPIGFVRTTAIGGLLLLLPLIVLGALIGQMVPIVMTIADTLADVLPSVVKQPGGIALLIVLSIAVLLALCFLAGLLARRSFVRNLSEAFEKKLVLLFPRYSILKDQMADTIGGDQAKAEMKPVLARFQDSMRIGFETERQDEAGLVSIYFPGSPDPWAGQVVVMKLDQIETLDAHFGDAVATCEQLGRGSIALMTKTDGQKNPA